MLRISTILLIAGIALLALGLHFHEIAPQVAGWFLMTTGFIQLMTSFYKLVKMFERHYNVSLFSIK